MTENKVIYLKGLNGLRAIAALSVVISHTLVPDFGNFGLPELFNIPIASFWVTMFFVISGFLITFLLLLEIKKTTTVLVGKFYLRRILRIWPIYYFYIGIVIIAALTSMYAHDVFSSQIFWYIFFAANIPFIRSTGISYLAHYWSIGVEEQFYLFWPWIVKHYFSKILYISIWLFLFLFLFKSILWFALGVDSFYFRIFTVSRFHCMMVGAIGAILFERKNLLIKYLDKKHIQALSWICILLIGAGIIHIPAPIAHEVFAVLSLSVIIGQINVQNRILNLENNILNFLGKISYGIYVIHPLTILLSAFLLSHFETGILYKYILAYSIVLGLTIGFAYVSYAYFENPFLNMKKKFAVIKSTASRK